MLSKKDITYITDIGGNFSDKRVTAAKGLVSIDYRYRDNIFARKKKGEYKKGNVLWQLSKSDTRLWYFTKKSGWGNGISKEEFLGQLQIDFPADFEFFIWNTDILDLVAS